MILLKAYQYFFYKLYRFYEASIYSKWWSEWKAYVTMLALSIWSYSAIEISYHYLFNIPLKSSNSIIDISTLVFAFAISALNWFLFVYQNKWKAIVINFDKLSKKQNRIGGIIVWVVIILILFFYWIYSIPLLGKITYN
ncbi:hypothetical protein CLU81_3656 [Flavobacterium sp. 9]|uniref:hypothetical protein n=1 Tax=Flavobacterium sp. 9 TaxID=2035198 RepID=UPI000C190854|nr:hypothetical protein [Flavobacterium sp. 9]PIF33082.1 hypothetical protein CLU81_3656 [Flavobacterium sp. 9]